MSLSNSDREIVNALRRRLRRWRVNRWLALLAGLLCGFNGAYGILFVIRKSELGTAAPSIIDVLSITVDGICMMVAVIGLAWSIYNWNGSRVERLLVRIAEILDDPNRDFPRE